MKKIALVTASILFLSGLAYGQEVSEDGITKKYYNNGQLKYEMIPNDANDGEAGGIAKGYYESGQLKYEAIFKDGILLKDIHKEYENGQLKEDKGFEFDVGNLIADGILKEYYEIGKLKIEINFKDGKIIDHKEYDEEGNLIAEEGERE